MCEKLHATHQVGMWWHVMIIPFFYFFFYFFFIFFIYLFIYLFFFFFDH